ncbi:MAG: PD-(D/E)XK nuclease family protein [Treponema sp.]|nr:PD-(D/E)XK nuclease family protein [Treponema sp.]
MEVDDHKAIISYNDPMEASAVDRILLEHAGNPVSLFVFPTDSAMNRWADRLLRLMGGGCLAMERFTAWDRFKNASIRSRMQDKRSVPPVLRKIFASRLLEENAAGIRERGEEGGFFKFLIPPAYAQGALSFAAWLSSMLPQLGSWFEKTRGVTAGGGGFSGGDFSDEDFPDGEDRDLFFLTLRYRSFLEEHKLFEPAWEKPPFEDKGRECFIFFPESLSDFSEYEALLEAAPHVHILRLSDNAGEVKPFRTFFYTNARSEITEAALYVRNLAEREGVAWEDMAVSLPEGEDYEPCALREFANRDIPVVRRVGKALSAYRAGRLFTDIQECCAQGFSFAPVSNLLLNSQLPWKNRDLIDQLIDFGINNNCLCSWVEQGRKVDVWLDAFNSLAGSREQRARGFYGEFKSALEKMHGARSFLDVLRYYFAFRERFLDMSRCGAEADAVLSRCISELLGLVEIENSFPDLTAPDPYGFFVEHLNETMYLAQETRRGVSILPYRTAACAPFACHIVLGASQDNLSMVFSRLGFLSRIKKERLGLADIDASEAFIAFHRLNSALGAAFFCSRQSFGGFKIPHSALGAAEEPRLRWAETEGDLFAPDLFAAEESALGGLPGNDGPSPRTCELHEVQAGGFRAWAERRGRSGGGPDLRGRTFAELMKKTYGGQKPRISATAMEPYFRCSVEWLYRRVLRLESRRMETTLMAENVTGSLYHAVLDRFFTALRGRPLAGMPEGLPEDYRALLAASIREVLEGLPLLPGEGVPLSSLTTRFLRAQAGAVQRQLEILLRDLVGFFGGFRVAGSELNYELEQHNYCLVGKVDLLLTGGEDVPDGAADGSVIVDFKLNYLPKRKACVAQGERGLENFQLPMYITLAEASGAPPVHTALFFRILKTDVMVIVGRIRDQASGKEKPAVRQAILRGTDSDAVIGDAVEDRFGAIMAEFAAKAEQYAEDIQNGRLAVLSAGEAQCGECAYRRVCRTLYTVDGERGLIAPASARPEEHHA